MSALTWPVDHRRTSSLRRRTSRHLAPHLAPVALLITLLVVIPACSAETQRSKPRPKPDPREAAATKALETVRAEGDADIAADLRARVAECVRIQKTYPDTRAGKQALTYAEIVFLRNVGDVSTYDRVYEDIVSTSDLPWLGGKEPILADMVAFREVMPAGYDTSRTRTVALALSVEIAEEHAQQIDRVGAERVSTAKSLGGGMTVRGGKEAVPDKGQFRLVEFERGLVKRLRGSERLDLAFQTIEDALRYQAASVVRPASTKYDPDTNTMRQSFTLAQIQAIRKSGEELERRARLIRELIRS